MQSHPRDIRLDLRNSRSDRRRGPAFALRPTHPFGNAGNARPERRACASDSGCRGGCAPACALLPVLTLPGSRLAGRLLSLRGRLARIVRRLGRKLQLLAQCCVLRPQRNILGFQAREARRQLLELLVGAAIAPACATTSWIRASLSSESRSSRFIRSLKSPRDASRQNDLSQSELPLRRPKWIWRFGPEPEVPSDVAYLAGIILLFDWRATILSSRLAHDAWPARAVTVKDGRRPSRSGAKRPLRSRARWHSDAYWDEQDGHGRQYGSGFGAGDEAAVAAGRPAA